MAVYLQRFLFPLVSCVYLTHISCFFSYSRHTRKIARVPDKQPLYLPALNISRPVFKTLDEIFSQRQGTLRHLPAVVLYSVNSSLMKLLYHETKRFGMHNANVMQWAGFKEKILPPSPSFWMSPFSVSSSCRFFVLWPSHFSRVGRRGWASQAT